MLRAGLSGVPARDQPACSAQPLLTAILVPVPVVVTMPVRFVSPCQRACLHTMPEHWHFIIKCYPLLYIN